MGTFCYNLVKFFLVIVNFFFWLLGILVVGLAIWMLIDPKFLISMAQDLTNYYVSVYILLVAGALLVILGFMGCCGAFKESQCMLMTFFSLLMIIVVGHIASVVWAYMNSEELEELVRSTMKTTVEEEYNMNPGRRDSFDAIQKGLQCCGADGPNDWIGNKRIIVTVSSDPLNFNIPESCCDPAIDTERCKQSTSKRKPGANYDPSVIYANGCIDKVIEAIRIHAPIVGWISLAILCVEFVGLILALSLMIAIKRSNRYKA